MTQYPAPWDQQWAADQAKLKQQVATLQQQVAQLTAGAVPVTSATHPATPYVGMQILETDTGNMLIWSGSAWIVVQTGAWTQYTATWTASGTAPSLGTHGKIVAEYSKVGRTVEVRVGLYGGSDTTWGSGSYKISLPFAANVASVPAGQFVYAGSIVAAAAGNTTFYSMSALIDQSTPSVVNGIVNGSGQFWGQGTPATFGTTAQAAIGLTYESVS